MPAPFAVAYARNERIYVKAENDFGTVNGVATSANAMRFMQATFKPAVELIERPDKFGGRGREEGEPGHRTGAWSLKWSLAPGAAAGSAPDCAAIISAIMGQDGVSASGQFTWTLLEGVPKSFTMWTYRPGTLDQRMAIGCLGRKLSFSIGKNVADVMAEGPCLWITDSEEFPTLADADAGKGGFTAAGQPTFPTEPSSYTFHGNMIQGYKGLLSVDGQTFAEFMEANISIETNNTCPTKVYGQDYGTIPIAGSRRSTTNLTMFDTDSVAQKNVRLKAKTKEPVDIIHEIGFATGARYRITLRGVQLEVPESSESGDLFEMKLGDSPASVSAGSTNDVEIKVY